MTRAEMADLMSKIFHECHRAREDGQSEYAHNANNVFANFDRTGKKLGLSREQVLMVFLAKHLDGISAYIGGHKSQREDVRGRIKDAVVYLCLLWGMVEDSEDRTDEVY